jgi:hypothetical protein
MARTTNAFGSFITRERKRLKKTYETARSRKAQIEQELQGIERELRAIDAYETAKSIDGMKKRIKRRTGYGRRGEKRERVLKIIQRNRAGTSRGDIIKRLGFKGDKRREQSVSNILTALKKSKQVESKSGKYVAT